MTLTDRPLRGILTGILTGALALTIAPTGGGQSADVIVRGTDMVAVAAAVAEHGGSVELEIGLIDAVSASVPATALDALRADGRVAEVTADARVQLAAKAGELDKRHRGITPDDAVTKTGGQKMMKGEKKGKVKTEPMDGTGIDVAIIDSGVKPGRVIKGKSLKQGVNLSFDDDDASRDGYGHGTAMASIIVGNTKTYSGSAADARVIDVKVADRSGMADISQVLAGLDWAVSNRNADDMNIRVISLSFGTDGSNDYAASPLAYAVEAAWRNGIVVVASAGNHGDSLGRLSLPAIDPYVIAVGAADVLDVTSPSDLSAASVPSWSATGDGVRNPDLVAPGRSVLAAIPEDSLIATQNPGAIENGDYILGSGTSQATAYTAGIVASMLEARPALTPDEVKAMLTSTAYDLTNVPATRDGHGVLNLSALFPDGKLIATPSNVAQIHGWSDGTGSLDGDRGSFILEDANGNLLSGENTVTGAFDRDAWLGSTWSGSTWSGSTWSGSTWSGSTWSGSTWSGSTWSGSTWSGSTWSSVRWGE